MLKRTNSGTLYHQVYDHLLDSIQSGALPVGTQLPTENELCEKYGVSRITIRRALGELLNKGFIRRESGKGTFVEEPRLNLPHFKLHSFTKEIENLGYKPGNILLNSYITQADDDVASKLEIDLGDSVLLVSRLRTANKLPLFVGNSYINIKKFPQLKDADYSCISLAELFNTLSIGKATKIAQWITVSRANDTIAKHLGLEIGSPILNMERVIYTSNDTPVEFALAYFHPNRYKNYTEVILE